MPRSTSDGRRLVESIVRRCVALLGIAQSRGQSCLAPSADAQRPAIQAEWYGTVSEDYHISLKRQVSDRTNRHYVGVVRDRMYGERMRLVKRERLKGGLAE